jgi:protein SCO1
VKPARALSLLLAALLPGLLPVLVPLAAAAAPIAAAPGLKAGVFEPPRQAPDFTLPGSDGRNVTLARYRGKVVLMSFGFTHCAAVCPSTLATLAQARKMLGTAASGVQVVFVTVDPQRDDAALLKAYLADFDSSFVGAAGSPRALLAVRKSYGVVATKVAMAGTASDAYAVDHTSSIFLIDRAGRLRGLMPYGRDAKDFVHDIQQLLAQ